MKFWLNAYLLFIGIILGSSFTLIAMGSKPKKFIRKGAEEHIVFYSKESVNSNKKIARKGVLIRRPKAKATVLMCHGFMCDKYDISFLHLIFQKYNTLAFDFRAHGEDVFDQACTFGRNEAYDVLAAVKFIKSDKNLRKLPLIIYGFSMGAVATIIAGQLDKNLCDAMILDCPFESSDKLLERGLNRLKLNVFGYEMNLGCSFLRDYAYNSYFQSILKTILKTFAHMDSTQVNTNICPVYPEEAIKYIKVPIFMIACPNDDKAPEDAVKSIYNGAKGFKRLWICDARRHFDPIFYRLFEYIYRVNKFIKEVLNNGIKEKQQAKIIVDGK